MDTQFLKPERCLLRTLEYNLKLAYMRTKIQLRYTNLVFYKKSLDFKLLFDGIKFKNLSIIILGKITQSQQKSAGNRGNAIRPLF